MSTKDFSSKQEKMIADYLGWQVVKGSGAAACHPGDIIGDDWLGECKTHETSSKPIFFSHKVWKKIVDEAAIKHRNPVLFTDDGSQKIDKTWCIFNSFMIDYDKWEVRKLPKIFKTNITLKHEQLCDIYSYKCDHPICYVASMEDTQVAILPLKLFYDMFC